MTRLIKIRPIQVLADDQELTGKLGISLEDDAPTCRSEVEASSAFQQFGLGNNRSDEFKKPTPTREQLASLAKSSRVECRESRKTAISNVGRIVLYYNDHDRTPAQTWQSF